MEKFEQNISAKKLLDMYSATVYRLCYSRTGNKADSEDITQEVFLKYIRAGKKFKDEEHRKAWILKVTVNCINTFCTAAYNRHRADFEEMGEPVGEIEEESDLMTAVGQLPEKYRQVIHLFYFEELSVKEVSEVTGDKEPTVKSQLTRARQMLKNMLKVAQFKEF